MAFWAGVAVLLHQSGGGLYLAELLIGLPLAVYSGVRGAGWVIAATHHALLGIFDARGDKNADPLTFSQADAGYGKEEVR